MRWLSHRGGALLNFADFKQQFPGERYPVVVALGADPVTILVPSPQSRFRRANTLLPVYCAVNDRSLQGIKLRLRSARHQ